MNNDVINCYLNMKKPEEVSFCVTFEVRGYIDRYLKECDYFLSRSKLKMLNRGKKRRRLWKKKK